MTPAIRWASGGAAAVIVVAGGLVWWMIAGGEPPRPDPESPSLARGRVVYAQQCASCHGENLEGQPNWRVRLPNGRLPAPPHDATGHTWHHGDKELFSMIKTGIPEIVP